MPICISDQEGNALKDKNIIEVIKADEVNKVVRLPAVSIVKDSNGKIYEWGYWDYFGAYTKITEEYEGENYEWEEPIRVEGNPTCVTDVEWNELLYGKTIDNVLVDYKGSYITVIYICENNTEIYLKQFYIPD